MGQARESLRQILTLVRSVGVPARPVPTRGRTERAEVNALFSRTFDAWSEDFERLGVQVAWSLAPQGKALRADLQDIKRDTDDFLASCLSQANLGMTLRLEWQVLADGIGARLYLEPSAPESGRGPLGRGCLPTPLKLTLEAAD